MSLGHLKHILSLEEPVMTPDGGGGFELVWHPVAELHADIAELAGSESLQARQLSRGLPCRITVTYRENVTTAMRLSGGGRVYEIVSCRDPDGAKAYLEIMARVMQA